MMVMKTIRPTNIKIHNVCTLGTHYHPTLDPAVLWTPSSDTSRPICSDSLNLMPPAPLYLRTLWRYTSAVRYYYY